MLPVATSVNVNISNHFLVTSFDVEKRGVIWWTGKFDSRLIIWLAEQEGELRNRYFLRKA